MPLFREAILAIDAALEAGAAIMEVYHSGRSEVEIKADSTPLTLADRRAHAVIAARLAVTDLPLLSEEGELPSFAERQCWESLWVVDPLDGTREFISRNGEFTVNIALVRQGRPELGVVYAPATGQLYFAATGRGAWFLPDAGSWRGRAEEIPGAARKMPFVRRSSACRVVSSRSHLDEETLAYIERLREENFSIEVLQYGSSLKFCMVAAGEADSYPRFGPTMEWDTAAGHAILLEAGKSLVSVVDRRELSYNKELLQNPGFIAR